MNLNEYAKEITGTFPVPDDEDGAEVTLRLLTPGEEDQVLEAATSTVFSLAGGDVPEMKLDGGKRGRLLLCKRIKEWKNIFDEKGEPLDCTDENKLKVAGLVPGFVHWVSRKYQHLEEDNKRREIELEGN